MTVESMREQNGVVRVNGSVSLIDLGDGIGCLEVHTKMNSLGSEALTFLTETFTNNSRWTESFDGFVIANDAPHFSVGANLKELLAFIEAGDSDAVAGFIAEFQAMTQAIKFCTKPVVAGVTGLCLGGGAEVALHSARIQANVELSMGLVESGVGLLPAGGGCKEMLLRAADQTAAGSSESVFIPAHSLDEAFDLIARARISTSAEDAKRIHLLRQDDGFTTHRESLLDDAKTAARRLIDSGYSPQVRRTVAGAGVTGFARLEQKIHQRHDAGSISDYDMVVQKHIAKVLCGGLVTAGSLLTEGDYLRLEREAFVSLCAEPKTRDRIAHTLKTGKILQN